MSTSKDEITHFLRAIIHFLRVRNGRCTIKSGKDNEMIAHLLNMAMRCIIRHLWSWQNERTFWRCQFWMSFLSSAVVSIFSLTSPSSISSPCPSVSDTWNRFPHPRLFVLKDALSAGVLDAYSPVNQTSPTLVCRRNAIPRFAQITLEWFSPLPLLFYHYRHYDFRPWVYAWPVIACKLCYFRIVVNGQIILPSF